MMFRVIFALFLLLAAPSSSYAADEWHIVSDQSRIDISYTTESFAGKGVLSDFQGQIKFSPEALNDSSVAVHIPIKSLQLDSLEYTRIAKEADWFDLTNYEFANFEATHFEAVDLAALQFLAKGVLTIKGQAQFIELPFSLEFSEDGEHVLMTSDTSIKRLAFKLGVGQWANTQTIADEVRLRVVLRAVRKK